jgi:integrase/recombinase XerD
MRSGLLKISKIRSGFSVPAVIGSAGHRTALRFIEFFAANIRNKNTRAAYARAVGDFLGWCEKRGRSFTAIDAVMVAAYVEERLNKGLSKPTVKQHLAAIRMLLDWMVTGGVLPFNPAASVRGPKYVIKKGKTPVLSAEDARMLLDSIDVSEISGSRDRALIAVMIYSFARVSAVVAMNVEDYYQQGKRCWLRLQEKGGKQHEVPAHHKAEEYLDAYIAAASMAKEKGSPLWRSLTKERSLGSARMSRVDAWRMIQRRIKNAELNARAGCHTFRATGITAYLLNGGTIENAQAIAAHESPRTTKLYDRTNDEITLDEVERIAI